MTIKVFLVDDHELLRVGLRGVLEAHDDITVVGEADSARRAITRIRAARPDVAILDVRLPDGDGVETCREIRAALDPPPACLMLTAYDDDDALFGAIMAGASGYLLKRVLSADVISAVRAVASGGSLLDPSFTAAVMKRLRGETGRPDPRYELLSPQERRVLDLVARGLTNREIGTELMLAETTVRNHVSSMLQKLRFERRTEAAVYATKRQRHDSHG